MRTIALAGLVIAAMAVNPIARADNTDMTSFAGTWQAHEEKLTIDADGNGQETYNDRSTCPDAPMSGCGVVGTVDFTLVSVDGDTATGSVTGASEAKTPVGAAVTIQLVGGGQGLHLTVTGGDKGFAFCNTDDDDQARHYYCGA